MDFTNKKESTLKNLSCEKMYAMSTFGKTEQDKKNVYGYFQKLEIQLNTFSVNFFDRYKRRVEVIESVGVKYPKQSDCKFPICRIGVEQSKCSWYGGR